MDAPDPTQKSIIIWNSGNCISCFGPPSSSNSLSMLRICICDSAGRGGVVRGVVGGVLAEWATCCGGVARRPARPGSACERSRSVAAAPAPAPAPQRTFVELAVLRVALALPVVEEVGDA